MGFLSFAGRVLFAAAFLLSAYQEFSEFGVDGGPAAKTLQPKFNTVVANISTRTGLVVPHIELKHVVAAMIALKGLGGLLFILNGSLGAYLLLFTKFAQNCALVGALLFFLAMKNSIPKRQLNRKKAPKPKTN